MRLRQASDAVLPGMAGMGWAIVNAIWRARKPATAWPKHTAIRVIRPTVVRDTRGFTMPRLDAPRRGCCWPPNRSGVLAGTYTSLRANWGADIKLARV